MKAHRGLAVIATAASGVAIAIVCIPLLGCSDSSDGGVLAGPTTLSVGSSGSADYASIGEAIDAAADGSTIVIEPGTYTERLSIGKALTIIGSGAGTTVEFPVAGPPDSAVIEIREVGGVRIESLVVRASQTDVDGIRVRDAADVVLDSVVAANNSQDGIDIKRSSGISVTMSQLTSNGSDGLQVDEDSSDVTIAGCVAQSNGTDGFKIRNSSDVSLEDSVSTSNGDDGILVRDAAGVRLVGNSSTDNFDWGISVLDSPDTVLENNTASGNGGGQVRCEPTCGGGDL